MSTALAITGLSMIVAAYAVETTAPNAITPMLVRLGHMMVIAGYFSLLVAKIKKARDGDAPERAQIAGYGLLLAFLVSGFVAHAPEHAMHGYDWIAVAGHVLMLAHLTDVRVLGTPVSATWGAAALAAYYAVSAKHRMDEGEVAQAVARVPLALAYATEALAAKEKAE